MGLFEKLTARKNIDTAIARSNELIARWDALAKHLAALDIGAHTNPDELADGVLFNQWDALRDDYSQAGTLIDDLRQLVSSKSNLIVMKVTDMELCDRLLSKLERAAATVELIEIIDGGDTQAKSKAAKALVVRTQKLFAKEKNAANKEELLGLSTRAVALESLTTESGFRDRFLTVLAAVLSAEATFD